MTLEEAQDRIGSAVTYWRRAEGPPEHGILVFTRGSLAFVLYQGDTAPKATRPEDLEVRGG